MLLLVLSHNVKTPIVYTESPGRILVLSIAVFVTALICGCAAQPNTRARDSALIAFGEQVFHDAGLSIDGSVSCSSCHQAANHFADSKITSRGVGGAVGTRNAPSLLDLPFATSFFWDGRETHLEKVVLQPFTNPVEMGLPNHETLIRRISEQSEYKTLVQNAFDGQALNADGIGLALTAFLRALPMQPTGYDLYAQSKGEKGLDSEAVNGLSLFNGKAGCSDCHRLDGVPASLTDNRFHHTGIGFEKVAGNISDMVKRLDVIQAQDLPLGQAILTEADIAELGRFATTRKPNDLGAFRTPSLRNVARTAPYMHDGSVETLQGAVEREIYYRSLARGRPISLTVKEQSELIAFLQVLNTDDSPESLSVHTGEAPQSKEM